MKSTSVAQLGQHVSFLSGFAFKSEYFNTGGEGLPIIRIRDVKVGHSNTYYSGEYDPKFVISDGDYLIGMDGDFSLARWRGGEALLNQRVCKVENVSDRLDGGYLARFLPSALKVIEDSTPFVTVKHLSVKTLREMRIPLPSLAEQCRIAAVLDQVDALRAKRRTALNLLDDLAQSIFFDMFGDPVRNEKSWPAGKVADLVASFESGKSLAQGQDENAEFRVLKVSAVTSGEFRPWESKPLPSGYEVPYGHLVRRGDLLFSRANTEELIGAVALVVNDHNNLALSDKLWRFVWRDSVVAYPLYVRHLFRQSEFRRQVRERSSGTSGSMKNISQANVLGIACGIPPIGQQKEFSGRMQSVERLQTAHRRHLAALDELFESLQQRAFAGQLWDHEAA